MKKTYILIILFTVIILGITAGIYIFISNENKRTENNNVEDVINKVSDKMEKDYTKELNELNQLDNSLETNSNEEKISPNCLIILKRHYDKCGHTTNEYIDIQEDLVNKTQDELEEKYPNILKERYDLDYVDDDFYEALEIIGRKRGCLMRGGIVDDEKVYTIIINDIKDGLIKNITFDRREEYES